MMKNILVLILVAFISCKETPKAENVSTPEVEDIDETELAIYDYDGLKPFLNQEDDKIHVVNFWATWCAPCIKELPYFETITKDYAHKNVEVLLVSLDFPRQYDTKLKPFLKKKQIKSKVVCFDDTDQNRWIPAIDSSWSGALPATIIYKGSKREFYEKSFTYEELEAEVQKFLN